MSFNQEFTIHPVGQGLFYSGKITHNNQVKFRMVFDCGSITAGAGQEEVKLYRDADFLGKKVLDLLVISHFDQDHVNHIGKLLADGIKVKKLVMPFISFSERLILVAKFIDLNDGFNPDDDFFLRFVIDPLGAMNENLDGDSDIFLIENGSDGPIPLTKNGSFESQESESNNNNEERFGFSFDNKEPFTEHSLTTKSELKIFKIKDSEKGKIKSSNYIKLMEFLFYRRTVGKDEEKFYDKVKELFFEKFSIDSNIDEVNHLDVIMSEVKKIDSGTKIKDIFKEAKEVDGFEKFKGLDIVDLNTTALSLLHKNLDGIFLFVGCPVDTFRRHYYDMLNHFAINEITHIQKFISSDGSRVETQNFHNTYPFPYYYDNNPTNNFIYPNVLLTSDSFLLTQTQVNEFMNHYRNHWNDYWLFQIPHHGSEKNSNGILHSVIPKKITNFINYGIGNRDDHPSSSVINSLVATGNSVKLISINQFSGIRFNLNIS